MRNVATMQNMTNDMNMHGGYEGHNLLELNYVSVPYEHRAGRYVVTHQSLNQLLEPFTVA
jgi:hypothetical protein